MENNICEPIYNSNYLVSTANVLVRGKQEDMTLLEAKLLRLIIMQVGQMDNNFKTYKCSIVDLAKFLDIPKNHIYEDTFQLCKSLLSKTIVLTDGKDTGHYKKNWKIFHWLDTAEYRDGTLILKISDELKPYILELREMFTKYEYAEILTLSSVYAIRFYELICSFQDLIIQNRGAKPFTFSIDYLRKYFNCEDKYTNSGTFIDKTVESAIQQINKKTNIYVEYKKVASGRKIVGIEVNVKTNLDVMMDREEFSITK